MKKTAKLIMLAVSIAILACALMGLSVSAAENEGALEIKSLNLVYSDKVELLVAVDVDNAERENVEVTYTLNGEKHTATLHPTETYTGDDDVVHPVFYTVGIAPKDIDAVMTFEAHVKDSGAVGTAYSASILDYLYARLYKNGFINKSEGEDLRRKNLYLNTISYASSAKDVLVNIKEGKSEPLFTDYVFVWSDDEKVSVEAGRPFGAFVSGTEITPVCDGPVTDWTLTNANDVKFGDAKAGEAFAVTDHTKLVAGVVDGPVTLDYENGAYNDFVKTYDADGNLITGNLPANANTLTMGLSVEGENHFMQVRNYAGSGKVGKTEVKLSNTIQTGNCYTFGARINVKGGTAGYNIAQLKFVNNNGGEALNLFLGYDTVDGKTGVSIKTTGSNSSITAGTKLFDAADKTIATGKWFDLCIEFYFGGVGTENAENTYIKVYVDNTLVYDGQANWAMGASITHAQIDHISAGKTHNSCYDDIYFTRTDKAYTAD